MQRRRGLLLLPEALVGCSDSECRRDCCSEVEEISAACSDFCSDAGEICKVGDSCSNAVLEFGGRKSSGVFSGRLRLAREQQPAVETKAVTVLPLEALPTDLILAATSAAVGCSEWLRLRGEGVATRGMVGLRRRGLALGKLL